MQSVQTNRLLQKANPKGARLPAAAFPKYRRRSSAESALKTGPRHSSSLSRTLSAVSAVRRLFGIQMLVLPLHGHDGLSRTLIRDSRWRGLKSLTSGEGSCTRAIPLRSGRAKIEAF